MKKFLVTGGAGFIGSHIVERLLSAEGARLPPACRQGRDGQGSAPGGRDGNFVRVLDNFSSGKRENLSFTQYTIPNTQYELIEGDIRDYSTCQAACEGIDFVLHQAALRSVPKSLENPKEYNEVNIQGTLNMLEASLKNKVKSFIFASSSSIYGEAVRFPEKEEDLPRLISPYALTKLTGEYYCRVFSNHYGLSCASLRYFNVFGPRQSLDDEYAVVIPKFINCILKDEPPPIFGTGRQSRDFTYVQNVVEANILATEKASFKGEVFNIASGRDYSILELVKILNKILNKNIKPIFLDKRAGDVFRTLADLSKAKRTLGFKPKIDFVEGLRLTVDWFKENA